MCGLEVEEESGMFLEASFYADDMSGSPWEVQLCLQGRFLVWAPGMGSLTWLRSFLTFYFFGFSQVII